MGQYFAAVVENEKGKKVFWPDGLKMVEHAYVEDQIARAVTWELRTPSCVAWVGDYAEPDDKLWSFWKAAWANAEGAEASLEAEPEDYDSFEDHKFVVDYDKEEYFDISEYMSKCGGQSWSGLTFFPIALMTAVGNGRGGGDYEPDNFSEKFVGIWAGDQIQVVDELPEGFEFDEIHPAFY